MATQSPTETSDLRIVSHSPLIAPYELKQQYVADERIYHLVRQSRKTIVDIIEGKDPRLLVLVGPCSIHDDRAALEYAERLTKLNRRLEERLYIVMRVYFEKPRTRLGWRGVILDPDLDGSYDINTGLRRARELLLAIVGMGLPAGTEFLDPIVPQYIDDLVSWVAIGARTTESQTHREMASGLSMPVGFKNGTDGTIDKAVDAFASSTRARSFIGIDQGGQTCVMHTRGNPNGHIILRGGANGPNYHPQTVQRAMDILKQIDLPTALMIDCNHGNSGKDPARQAEVLESILQQRTEGNRAIIGCMIESNLTEGRQDIPDDHSQLRYGVSITDACIGWAETERLLQHVFDRRTPLGYGDD